MMVGKVKWYRQKMGYGLITPENGGEDVFVHHSSIANNKIKGLLENQHVKFEVKESEMGPQAMNVQCLSLS